MIDSEKIERCGYTPDELYEWVLSKTMELSFEKPEFPTEKSFLLYAYQQIIELVNLAVNDYFNIGKELSFYEALRRELIRLEDIPFTDDGEREETVETDIRMLKRSMDILKEFDRFIERIGGYE